MSQSSQLSHVFKSRLNILLQLKKQGYDTGSYDGFSMGEMHAMFQAKQMDMLLTKRLVARLLIIRCCILTGMTW